MPTVPQIEAAKLQLATQPYDPNASALESDSVATLHVFLRKYVLEHKQSGRYSGIGTKLAAAIGITAAQLQAVLNNVSAAGSKVATLQGEVGYSTQTTIDNELAFALLVMYEPITSVALGTKASEMAQTIRAHYCTNCWCPRPCGCSEFQITRRGAC